MNQRNMKFAGPLCWILLIIIGILWFGIANSADLETCIQRCKDASNPSTSSVFPDKAIWEETTTEGKGEYQGTAAVVFPSSWSSKITTVMLDDEVAALGTPWKNNPVYRFKKIGSKYSSPITIYINTASKVYTFQPTVSTPAGAYINKGKFKLSVATDGTRSLRTTETGSYFGKSLKFVYDSGYTFLVPDSSKRFEEGNRQTIYRHGGTGPIESKNNNTSHGGMGIWTLKAKGSSYVTIYASN